MATSLSFEEKHIDIISTATYVCTWPQSALKKKAARTATAKTEYHREEAHLKELQLGAKAANQRL